MEVSGAMVSEDGTSFGDEGKLGGFGRVGSWDQEDKPYGKYGNLRTQSME